MALSGVPGSCTTAVVPSQGQETSLCLHGHPSRNTELILCCRHQRRHNSSRAAGISSDCLLPGFFGLENVLSDKPGGRVLYPEFWGIRCFV